MPPKSVARIEIKTLSHEEVQRAVMKVSVEISDFIQSGFSPRQGDAFKAYPIPRGGIPVAYLLKTFLPFMQLVNNPEDCDIFIDDVIDTGKTASKYTLEFKKPVYALFNKAEGDWPTIGGDFPWLVFPWESLERSDDDSSMGTLTNNLNEQGVDFYANDSIAQYLTPEQIDEIESNTKYACESLLRALMIDTANDHNCRHTAERMAKMMVRETLRGRYFKKPVITEFPNAKGLDEVYSVGPITVRSLCSHHFQPIVGKAWVGVLPRDRLIGLSKFSRIIEWFASRPQIQEEMVIQIANEFEQLIRPLGLAVVIEASHGCMICRGVKESPDCKMVTSVMRGVFREKPEARAEFLSFVNK